MSRYLRRLTRNQKLAGTAVAAGLLMAVTHGHTAPGGTVAASGVSASASGTLTCSQLEALWESAGGAASAAFMAAEVAKAESSGQQYAANHDADGSTDRGYWQINTINGPLSTYDPRGNAKAAVLLSNDGTDWAPWTTYQTGAYAGKC